MVQNKAFIYKQTPHGFPTNKDLTIESTDFDLDAAPPPGGFTTKNFYAAFDPSQRGRMRDPAIKSYSPAMTLNEPVSSVSVIGKVLKSDAKDIKEGSIVLLTSSGTESYSIVTANKLPLVKVLTEQKGVPLTAHLGALGMTGMTAYGSLHEIGQPKKGQTILVSAAAGAVGQMVGQFAVREGLKVIGSVGDDAKLEFITKELGFTSGFNYKKENMKEAVERLAPEGLDIFYDNVGGDLLDVALNNMKEHGRISKCSICCVLRHTDNVYQLHAAASPPITTSPERPKVSRITVRWSEDESDGRGSWFLTQISSRMPKRGTRM